MLALYGSTGSITVPWIPALGINLTFYIDGLATLIGFLASGIGILILFYSGGYMHGESHQMKYYASLLAFMGSMLGVAFAGDLILLFVFWELTSVSSFMLIGHYQEKKSSQYAARKSMLITVGGGLFMLIGFLLIQSVTGTFSMTYLLQHPEAVQASLRSAGLFLPALGLLTIGAAAKSAQVPLHIWLPNAMEAPTPVSAFLHSATMVKAGVYLLGRFRPVMLSNEWMMILVTLGLTTMTVAGILAVSSTDIKELLAYSTASHLGLIVAGLGFTTYIGAETAGFHILNHALFKASLFLVAGIVAHEAGTRTISKLSGLRHELPYTAVIGIVAGLAMGGIPPFNGFMSKELLFESAWHAATHLGGFAWMMPVVAVFGSVFTFAYSIKFISLFFGEKNKELGHIHKPPIQMLLPPIWLMLGVLAVTVMPQTFVNMIVQSVTESLSLHTEHHMHVSLIPHLSPAFGMSLVTMGLGLGVFKYYDTVHNNVREFLLDHPYFTANWWYDNKLAVSETVSDKVVNVVHHEQLRGYVSTSLVTFSILAALGFAAVRTALPAFTGLQVGLPMLFVLGVAVVGAFAVIKANSHVSGILTLSILGAMVAIFYILAMAPDLALTQLVVETLSLIIFILILDKLPSFYGEIQKSRKAMDAALATVVGAVVSLTVIVSTSGTPDKIASYFVEKSLSEGGGANIVNVILVDFRGLDTMGEISVIAMAALAVVTLISMRTHHPWFREDEQEVESGVKQEVTQE
jgi:multicomponent Na+:H+ antiporter subunit A